MNEDRLVVFSLAVSGISLYSHFMPNIAETVAVPQSDGEKKAIREAEILGLLHLLAIAGITSYYAKSSLPIMLALLLGASMFATYEYAFTRSA